MKSKLNNISKINDLLSSPSMCLSRLSKFSKPNDIKSPILSRTSISLSVASVKWSIEVRINPARLPRKFIGLKIAHSLPRQFWPKKRSAHMSGYSF